MTTTLTIQHQELLDQVVELLMERHGRHAWLRRLRRDGVDLTVTNLIASDKDHVRLGKLVAELGGDWKKALTEVCEFAYATCRVVA